MSKHRAKRPQPARHDGHDSQPTRRISEQIGRQGSSTSSRRWRPRRGGGGKRSDQVPVCHSSFLSQSQKAKIPAGALIRVGAARLVSADTSTRQMTAVEPQPRAPPRTPGGELSRRSHPVASASGVVILTVLRNPYPRSSNSSNLVISYSPVPSSRAPESRAPELPSSQLPALELPSSRALELPIPALLLLNPNYHRGVWSRFGPTDSAPSVPSSASSRASSSAGTVPDRARPRRSSPLKTQKPKRRSPASA